MVYIFEFFKFSTLLTWIFETISRIISNEIWKFHACVEMCAWSTMPGPRHLFPQFHTLFGLLYVVVIYRTSSVVKRAWPPWSQHLQNHYVVSMPHNETIRWFWMAFTQCDWITDSSDHYAGVGQLQRRLSKLAKRQPWTTHPEFSSQARLWDLPTHLEAAPHNHEKLRFRWRGSCWLSQRSTSAKYESGEIEKYRSQSF